MGLLWKLGGIALACVAAYFLVTMYGKSRYNEGVLEERGDVAARMVKAEKEKLAAYQAGLDRQQAAETIYHETVRTLPPVTHTIIERSKDYAQTPAGAAECLPADRVLWLEQQRVRLFPPTPAATSGPATAVLADAPSR